MAKLNDELKEKILAEHKSGLSQAKLAKEYGLSLATINKLCKGKEQTNAKIVSMQLQVNQAMDNMSKLEAQSVQQRVFEAEKIRKYFNDAALKNQLLANELLDGVVDFADIEAHSRITQRNKDTVLGKMPQTQINNAVIGDSGELKKIIIERKEIDKK